MTQTAVPSVEEILAAIKQVIARDQHTAASHARDDILDLAALEADEPMEDSLLAVEARASMRESLAALSMLSEPRAQPQIVRSGETSLEGLVRELLRPQLAAWLDAHLPALVEKLVAAEIARIVGKKG